jgi:hypothetical protein
MEAKRLDFLRIVLGKEYQHGKSIEGNIFVRPTGELNVFLYDFRTRRKGRKLVTFDCL